MNSTDQPALRENDLAVVKELFGPAIGGKAALRDPLFPETAAITGPTWLMKSKEELFVETEQPVYIALGEFTGELKTLQILTMDQASAEQVAAHLSGGELEGNQLFSAVQDMTDRLFGSAASALSMLTGQQTGYSLSGMDVLASGQAFPFTQFTKDQWFAEALFTLSVGDHHHVSFRMYLPAGPCRALAEELAGPATVEEAEETQAMTTNDNHETEKTLEEQSGGQAPTVQSVQFSSFDEAEAEQSAPNNLNMLLDIPLQVTVELGRTKRVVKEILEMSQGSIIELDKLAGEPVDILINNKLIAVGEVVVIDENFGVRVTDILSTAERISKLR